MNTFGLVNSYLTMPDVARLLGYTPNKAGFIRSPFHDERTPSCKLYNEPGRGYCDFSSGDAGDCIRFTARVLQVNNWEACRYLVDAFHLPINTKNSALTKRKVQELKQQREADRKHRILNKQKTVSEMDSLKSTIRTCENLLINPHIEPLSDVWCLAVEQRNRAIILANEMCGIETFAADLRLPERPKEREVS